VYIGTGGAVATFSKTGTSVIYGDTNKNPDDDNLTDNTAKSADSGGGHAVYFARSPTYYRDSDLLSGVGISTSDTVTNWNQ
jgi:hypothetical protein